MEFKKNNYDDVFLRDLTICVLSNFENSIVWTNNFESGDVEVNVPIYYSLTGGEDFLLDSFVDDIVSSNRKSELNTDVIPRAQITFESMSIKSDEFCNPNTWIKKVTETDAELIKVTSRLKAIPIKVNYTCSILLESEIDTFKCIQSLINNVWFYKYIYFEYNFMHIDAYLQIPDEQKIEIIREQNMTSVNKIKIDFTFEVHTYFPSFNDNQLIRHSNNVKWLNELKSAKKRK